MGYVFGVKNLIKDYRFAQARLYFISAINSNCQGFLFLKKKGGLSNYNSSKIVWERRFSFGKSRPIPSGSRKQIVSISTLSITPKKTCKCQS